MSLWMGAFGSSASGGGVSRWVKFEGSGRLGATYQWTVPAGVHLLSVSGCGGGGGGGGGVAAGGGGGAGGVAMWHEGWPLEVEPGWVLDIEIGAGGSGGAPGSDGTNGAMTSISHDGEPLLNFLMGYKGLTATGTTGGWGGGAYVNVGSISGYSKTQTGSAVYLELSSTELNRGRAVTYVGTAGLDYGVSSTILGGRNQFVRVVNTSPEPASGGAIGLNPRTCGANNPYVYGLVSGGAPSVNGGNAPALDTLGLINLWGVGGGGGAGDVGGAGADGWSGVVFIYY